MEKKIGFKDLSKGLKTLIVFLSAYLAWKFIVLIATFILILYGVV